MSEIQISKAQSLERWKAEKLSLAKIRKDCPLDGIIAISYIIEKAYKFASPSRKLDSDGIVMVAGEILKDFYYMKIDEFDNAIMNGVKGKYGTSYSTIDGSTIYKWCEAFNIAKEEKAADERERQRQQYKEAEKRGYDKTVGERLEIYLKR